MAELGDTEDPKALIPGNPEAIHKTAWSMTVYGDLLHEAGTGLRRIDTTEGWSGEAAEQFRSTFHGQPGKWLQAGDCFHAASKALDGYIATLTWAQREAAEAIELWNEGQAATRKATAKHDQAVKLAQQQPQPGAAAPAIPFADPGEAKRQAAQEMLNRARTQLHTAGDQAADAVGQARDQAPEAPGLLEQAGDALTNAASAVGNFGAEAVNAVASVGNAVLHNPGSVVATAAGIGLTAVSATGEVAGVVADATGAGAVVGGPVNVVSAAGIATGVGMAGAGMANIAHHAAGDDAVHPLDTDNDVPAEPPADAGAWDHVEGEKPNPADIHTTEGRKIHILDGEGNGKGGHVAGTGNPGKTEFPESWDDDKIINNIEDVAKAPDRPPTLEQSGNYKFNGTRDGVEIEGYVTPEGQVQTGYPLRGDGVTKNDEFGNPHPVP